MKLLLKNKMFILDIIIIVCGTFISSLGINLFISNAKLLSGGATGIALIFQYLFNIPSGLIVFLINIPLFFVSYKFLSKRFTMYTALGMMSFSLSLILTKPLAAFIRVDDVLLYCIYGGIINGIGGGLVFSRNGSTGGIDIITMVIRKNFPNFNIGKLNFCFNLIIVAVGALIFGLPQALYTLISMSLQGFAIDKVISGFTSKKLFLVLTERENDIINYVLKDMHRGITSLMAEGEFTGHKRKLLYVAVTSSQMISLRRKILNIDPNAFITIVDVSEVKGNGFQSI